MKKFILILSFFIIIALVSCEPEMYYFDSDILSVETTRIELIEYSTDEIQRIESEDEIASYDFNNEEVLEVLDLTENVDIFADLSNIEFHKTVDYSKTPIGISLKITYNNGSFTVISSKLIDNINYGGAISYNSSGDVVEFLGNFAERQQFIDLINKYFDISSVNF